MKHAIVSTARQNWRATAVRLMLQASLVAWITVAVLSGAIAAPAPGLPPGLTAPSSAPGLPPGLGAPALPPGLAAPSSAPAPALPPGLGAAGDEPAPLPTAAAESDSTLRPQLLRARLDNLAGFSEIRLGIRTGTDQWQRQTSIAEARLQLDWQHSWQQKVTAQVTTDLLYDHIRADGTALNLHTGAGWLDLRQANVMFTPLEQLDIKFGRQILTWGTGDLLFINDLFAKDWRSFFLGRDVEYLKAPSDALKLSLFSPLANLDLVYTPRFSADRYISGRQISYWNHSLGRRAGRDAVIAVDLPKRYFDDDEYALRVFRNFAGYEYALYFYDGFWKSPAGIDAATGVATFPRLRVYGASVRGAVAAGIVNAELGYYDSRDDRRGSNALVNNSETRLLLGYEQELARDFSAAWQYYLEYLNNYSAYRNSLPAGALAREQYRHLLSMRLTQMLLQQTLNLSLFVFYSPSDQDFYLRPRLQYAAADNWSVEVGANIFAGRHRHSFFAQFADNSNVYAAIRRSF